MQLPCIFRLNGNENIMKTIFYHFKDEFYHSRSINEGYMPESVHFHAYYEISIVRSGTLHIICQGTTIERQAPCILLIRPYVVHEIMSERGTRFDCASFYCSSEISNTFEILGINLRDLFPSALTIIPLTGSFDVELLNLVDSWKSEQSYRNYNRMLLGSIIEAIRHHIDDAEDPLTNNSTHAVEKDLYYVYRVADYISEHFSEQITSDEIASNFYISRQKLDADFKRVMKTTLKQYIISIRVSNAAQLMTQNYSISEVTEMCGFSNESHFIRTFKKHFSISPYHFSKHCDYLLSEQRDHLYAHEMQNDGLISSDHPIPGGRTYFGQKEFMYTGEPSALRPWCNAFCRASWTGCIWHATHMNGRDCICIMPVSPAELIGHFMDFNYYQYNNDVYYPSLDCSEYRYLRVRYLFNSAASQTSCNGRFSISPDMPVLGTTFDKMIIKSPQDKKNRNGFASYIDYEMPTEPNVWHTLLVDLSSIMVGDKPWKDITVRQFRYMPFGIDDPDPGALCYIESIAFFRTREEAEAEE